jgi:hypothetical protein
MATYRIVCVTTEHAHRHITSVGVGTLAGVLFHLVTVQQVHDKLDRGDTFYTVSLSTGRRAKVKKDTCGVGGCVLSRPSGRRPTRSGITTWTS